MPSLVIVSVSLSAPILTLSWRFGNRSAVQALLKTLYIGNELPMVYTVMGILALLASYGEAQCCDALKYTKIVNVSGNLPKFCFLRIIYS